MNIPERGEVWLADLGMVAKVRPVLVLSTRFGDQDYALFHVVPHTTTVRGSQFEAAVEVTWLQRGVFNVQGSQSVPRVNLLRRLGSLNVAQLESIEAAVRRWLAL